MEFCSIPECEGKVLARGWCNKHYRRWYRHGDPLYESPPRVCSVEGCSRPHQSLDLCGMHYQQFRTHGGIVSSTPLRSHSLDESFRLKTEESDSGCLLWTGYRDSLGYGQVRHKGVTRFSHRVAWERVHGEIPSGFDVNHRCWNPSCVNVEHLELATRQENMRFRPGPNSNNTSGFRNVIRDAKSGKFRAQVWDGEKHHFSPLLESPEKAAEFAEILRRDLFGDFAGRG